MATLAGAIREVVYAGTVTLPVISDVFRCAFEWDSGGLISSPATNVMHFKGAGITESDVFNALDGAFVANNWAQTSSDASIVEVVIQKLDGASAAVAFATASAANWSGTHAGGDITPAVAAIVKEKTAKRGRSYRGRIFLPWLHESAMANGAVDGTELTNLQTAWSAWLTAMHGGAVEPVVASYQLATAEPITDVVVEQLLATQRRRQMR